MRLMKRRGFTAAEKTELWDRWQRGESLKGIGRAFGKPSSSIYAHVSPRGGIRPAVRRRSRLALTLCERETISRGIVAQQSTRSMARLLGRSPSTVSREISRNGGYNRYRAAQADKQAWVRARRPKPCKLASSPRLRQTVARKLRLHWSPEQIAGWLMKLVVATRGSVPLVDVSIQVDTGSTASPADAPGLASFVFGLLDKGTKKYDANELAAAKDKIGMGARSQAGLERSSLRYRILDSHLRSSMVLAAEILRNPTFPEEELVKFQARVAAWLSNLKLAPADAAGGLFDRAIYGGDTLMGAVWTPQLIKQVDRAKLEAFHRAEVAPDNMTVYMIGNIGIDEAREAVENAFGKWKTKANSNRQPVGKALVAVPRVILVDYPGAESSTIYAGHAIAPYDPESWTELSIMNRAFGGGFESRLNMNLREDKGWSYGYRSGVIRNSSGDMTLASSGQVQTDKTMESMVEIKREFEEYVSTRPATSGEIDRIKLNRTRSLPGTFATNSGFLASIIAADSYGLPFDYAETSAARIESVTVEGINKRARSSMDPSKLTWIVVGDLEKIEEKIRSLNYGEVEVWDAYGNKLR